MDVDLMDALFTLPIGLGRSLNARLRSSPVRGRGVLGLGAPHGSPKTPSWEGAAPEPHARGRREVRPFLGADQASLEISLQKFC